MILLYVCMRRQCLPHCRISSRQKRRKRHEKEVLFFVMYLKTSFCRTAVDVRGISGSGQTVYDSDTCQHTVISAVSTVAPACTDIGYTLFECDGCGMTYKGQLVQETEHSYAVIQELSADLYSHMECRYQCGNYCLTNDLNSDNIVDIRDIVRLKKILLGIVKASEICVVK